jgi:hypothetical protein
LRKLAAILLWGILLFNWVGYRLLNSILEDRANRRLDARLDQDQYEDDQLIAIKVPITHLAYYNNSAAFERADGEIEVDGIPYRYVKRRICNDTLEMLCIPNQGAIQLRQSGKNYFNGVNDIEHQQGSPSGSHPGAKKSFATDPFICIQSIQMDDPMVAIALNGYHFIVKLPSLSLPMDERPPIVAA